MSHIVHLNSNLDMLLVKIINTSVLKLFDVSRAQPLELVATTIHS